MRARWGGRGLFERGLWRALVVGPGRQVLRGMAREGEGADGAEPFQRDEIERLLDKAWDGWLVLAPELPAEPSLSGRISVLAAGMLLAVMQALIAAGVERDYATRIVRDIGWAAYMRSMGMAGPALLRKLARDPMRRLHLATEIGLRLEFTEPSYHHRRVRITGGDGFDMLRCPIADYLKAQDASDLCVTAFCSLDFRIFQLIGMRLERSGTISAGASFCDFRAYPAGG